MRLVILRRRGLLCILWLTLLIGLTGCIPPPPENPANLCSIFTEYPTWYWATRDTQKKWGVPINVQMAIMYQESRFVGSAKPPRGRILWIIPWFRPSSAYGYAQALDGTWDHYVEATGNGSADRDEFADASDFIGWYGYEAYRQANIPRNNAYRLYLAYHEGIGGYRRGSFNQKPWLIQVARKVNSRANLYQSQYNACKTRLPEKHWWQFWHW